MDQTIIRTCTSCGRQNRVRAAQLWKNIRCGACKTVLGPLAEPVDATPALFDELVRTVTVPILVDFWAAWCGPCRMAAPEVARAAAEMAGRAIVVKVDTEQYPELGARYQVRGIPNFVVIKDGRVAFQQAGVVPHTQLRQWLEAAERTVAAQQG